MKNKTEFLIPTILLFIAAFAANFMINQDAAFRFHAPKMGLFILMLLLMGIVEVMNRKRDVICGCGGDFARGGMLKLGLMYLVSIFAAMFMDSYINYIRQFIGYEEPNNYNVAAGKYVALMLIVLVLAIYEIKRSGFGEEVLEWYVIINAFLLRLVYVINTGIDNAWSNDVGGYAADDTGHLAYINTILTTGHFPTDPANGWEYPQPPLWHLMCAGWAKINMLVFDKARAFENLQYLSVFVSAASIIVALAILKQLKVSGKNRLLVLGIVGFMPHFVLMSGNLNNDGLVTLLELLLVLLTIRYYKKNDVASILLLAVCFGLAMMAKLSAAVYALPIGVVMIYMLVRDVKDANDGICVSRGGALKNAFIGRIVKHYIPFVLVAGPLSLWWSIRLKLMYGLPFGYFQPMNGGDQYLGDYPLLKRLIGASHQLDQFNICRYNGQQNTDYNVFIMYIKYSIFGETYDTASNAVITMLGASAFALLVCIYAGAVFYVVRAILKKRFKLTILDAFVALSAIVPVGALFIRALTPSTAQSCNMNIRFAMAGIMTFFVWAARDAYNDVGSVNYGINHAGSDAGDGVDDAVSAGYAVDDAGRACSSLGGLSKMIVLCFAVLSAIEIVMLLTV